MHIISLLGLFLIQTIAQYVPTIFKETSIPSLGDQSIPQQQLHLKHLHPTNSSRNITNQNRTQGLNGESQSQGLKSPYNVFLEDNNGEIYFTSVKVESLNGLTKYKVCVDINQPFTLLTEIQGLSNDIHFTKMHISKQQTDLIVKYIKPKFSQIDLYSDDIYYVLNSTFWINENLHTDFSFFYLIGYGAYSFQYETALEGILGLGINHLVNEPSSLNIVIQLFETYVLTDSSFAIYFGNDPGYIDSVLYVGGYQNMFLQNNVFEEVKIDSDKSQLWRMKIENVQLLFKNSTIYSSQQPFRSFISSSYPFILLPIEITTALQNQIQKDGSINCEYHSQIIQGINVTLLQCSSKMPVIESLKCPRLIMQVQKVTQNNGEVEYTELSLDPSEYIQKCLYDVENYAQICQTNIAIKNQAIKNLMDIQLYSDTDIILGLPFLKSYYSFYQLQNSSLMLAKAYQFSSQPQYSQFWYYSLMALLIFWALLMMSCGIYFKDQMDQLMHFVANIVKFIMGNQQARQQLIIGYLVDDQQ